MSQALEAWFGNFSESFNAIKIGRIEGVNLAKQTVDVQILHKKVNKVFKTRELKDYPLLKAVPFIVLGGGDSYLTFPISVGDNCLLLFCDYEIDRWWDTGESLPANFERRHDISDAFALVGVHSMVELIQGYSQFVKLKYSDLSYISVGNVIDVVNSQTNVSGNLTVVGNIIGNATLSIAQNITGNAKLNVLGDIKGESKLNITGNITGSSNLNINGNITGNGKLDVTGDITGSAKATAELHSTHGATGTFTNVGGVTLTIVDGIITNIA